MEAQLDAAHEFLKALPPKKYDRRMEQRRDRGGARCLGRARLADDAEVGGA
jgi:hypothetical protein